MSFLFPNDGGPIGAIAAAFRAGASRPLAAVACGTVLAACGAGEGSGAGAPDAFTVRDSSGIRIVTSREPLWRGTEGLRLAPEPEVTIGAVSGAPEYLFSHIEGVARLSDGRIVVGDRPSQEVRWYSPEGRFLFRAAGEGEGPGELGSLRALRRCGADSIYAFETDWSVEVFDASGTFVRRVAHELPPSFAVRRPYELSCGGGRFLVNGWGDVLGRGRTEFFRTTSPVALLAAAGAVQTDVGGFPGAERLGGSPYPMGKALVHAVGPERIYLGTADRFEIEVRELDGSLVAVWRRDTAVRPWDGAHLEEWARRRAGEYGFDPDREAWRARDAVAGAERPVTFPAYTRFLLDDRARLWVEEFGLPGAPERAWHLFRPDGVWLGTVRVPAGLELHEVTAGRVVGKTRDEVGVERAVAYRLLER